MSSRRVPAGCSAAGAAQRAVGALPGCLGLRGRRVLRVPSAAPALSVSKHMGTAGGSAADILPGNLCPAAIDGCLSCAGSGAAVSVDVFVRGGEKIWAGNVFSALWMVNFWGRAVMLLLSRVCMGWWDLSLRTTLEKSQSK